MPWPLHQGIHILKLNCLLYPHLFTIRPGTHNKYSKATKDPDRQRHMLFCCLHVVSCGESWLSRLNFVYNLRFKQTANAWDLNMEQWLNSFPDTHTCWSEKRLASDSTLVPDAAVNTMTHLRLTWSQNISLFQIIWLLLILLFYTHSLKMTSK